MSQKLKSAAPNGKVVLWVDSFTRSFSPEVVRAIIAVLNEAGFEAIAPAQRLCCGLTWITTGQLDTARERIGNTIGILAEYARAGLPIIGIEPSCVATLRSDAVALLGETPDALAVARSTNTLAELLVGSPNSPRDLSWLQNRLAGVSIVAQPHCHHYSVMGWAADQTVLELAGAELTILNGCCGLAGNFGMERGHYELSKAIAERMLLPSLRDAKPGTVLLADGFSCRIQAHQLSSWNGKHLAQLLASKRC
jgi:Fe-S oxidoreductase